MTLNFKVSNQNRFQELFIHILCSFKLVLKFIPNEYFSEIFPLFLYFSMNKIILHFFRTFKGILRKFCFLLLRQTKTIEKTFILCSKFFCLLLHKYE